VSTRSADPERGGDQHFSVPGSLYTGNEQSVSLQTSGIIIPIYEYACQGCGHEFEALVRGSATPACPECESTELERKFSLPTMHTSGSHDMAMRAAKARDRRQGSERMHAQREYELNHDDH